MCNLLSNSPRAWTLPLIGAILSTSLAGCVVPSGGVSRGSSDGMYLAEAKDYIRQGDWNKAYTFLEDVFDSSDPELRKEARALADRYPEIKKAGLGSFSVVRLVKWVKVYEDHGGALNHQHRRLEKFCQVASLADCGAAQENLQAAELELKTGDSTLREAHERRLRENAEGEQARLREQAEAHARLLTQLEKAITDAVVTCRDKVQCDKMFALTQIYIDQVSDMKLQVTTDAIIETYGPNENGKVGLKAVRLPGRGTSAKIALRVVCRAEDSAYILTCDQKRFSAYSEFPVFIERMLQD